MADAKMTKQAKNVLKTLCKVLDREKLKYNVDEKDCTLSIAMQGADLPIRIMFKSDADRGIITGISHLDYVVAEDKRYDMAVAVTMVNYRLVMGSFDYDLSKGKILYRMTTAFMDSVIGEAAMKTLFFCIASTVERYNDKFLKLSMGAYDLAGFSKDIDQ